ncbi:MAG: hypothetical protein IKF10_00395 [Lachnospiraceae bacterium]|nr:hypothetical protein [Lachnospiraceae bacterium]
MDFIRRHLALILQLVLTVILVGAVVFRVFSSDRNGPEIVLPDSEMVLTGSTTDAQLFEGLTASDETDGDVSDTLKLESVTKVSDNLVLLVYAAKDKSNNVSTVTRALMTNGTFTYKGMIEAADEPAAPGGVESDTSSDTSYPPESGLAASSETVIPGDSSLPSDTESSLAVVPDTDSIPDTESIPEDESETVDSSVEESTPTETESAVADESTAYIYDTEMSTEDNYDVKQFVNIEKDPSSFAKTDIETLDERLRNANNMSISRLPDGYPVIRLNTYAVSKRATENFSALDFISDIRDDADPTADIFGRISVTGNGNLDKPGIYTVNYYVTDSEGNRSNVAHLIVVVTK